MKVDGVDRWPNAGVTLGRWSKDAGAHRNEGRQSGNDCQCGHDFSLAAFFAA
jgi:hypothetical protein